MDPATILDSAYKIGGTAAVLLALIVIGVVAVWRNEVKRYNALSVRLTTVETRFTTVLVEEIQQSRLESAALKRETNEQTKVLRGMWGAMRERPCLNSGAHQIQKTPLPDFPMGSGT